MIARVVQKIVRRLPPNVVRRVARSFMGGRMRWRLLRNLSDLVARDEVAFDHGPLKGFRFVAEGSNAGFVLGVSEPAVQQVLGRHLHSGQTFYDIGANVGYFTLLAARAVGDEGHVYAFEPLPGNIARLERNLSINSVSNVTVLGRAVGLSSGQGSMTLAEGDTPISTGLTASLAGDATTGSVPVVVTSVDDALEREGLRPPDVVKIDVEGGEMDVIAGMRRTLERYRPAIVCEVHGADEPTLAAFGEVWEQLGYRAELLESEEERRSGAVPHYLALPR